MSDRISHQRKFLLKISTLIIILVLSKGQKELIKPTNMNFVAENMLKNTDAKTIETSLLDRFSIEINNYLK